MWKRSAGSLPALIRRAAACRRAAALPPGHHLRATHAFTLVEVLVVIGVIVILVGAIGVGLSGRGGEGAALANSQRIVTGLVGATRAQAALHQTNARLAVYAQMPPGANADAAKYLRALQVVRQETNAAGGTVWVAVGDPVTLPAPICVVPPPPVPASHLPTGMNWVNNPATGPVSTGLTTQNAGFSYAGQSGRPANMYFGRTGNGRIHYLEFGPDGTVVSNSSGNLTKIALTTAVLAGNALPQFNNANTIRGLIVRRTGAVSMVNSATGF